MTLDPSVWQSGQPLTPSLSARMAAGFAQPVSHLRLHTDARAAHLADALGAHAFTAGSHIFFGADQSPEDLELMAHETAHALQQPAGAPSGALRVGEADSAHERMADHAASAILAGGSAPAGADAPAHIARKKKKKRGLFAWAAEKLEDPGEFIEAVVEHPFDATVGDASGAFAEGVKQDVKEVKELGSDALGAMRKNAEMVRAGGDSVESWLVKNQKKGAAFMYAHAKSNDTPVLGSLLGANAWVADQTGQAGTGILGGAVSMGSGVLAAATNPVDAALGLLKLGAEIAPMTNPLAYPISAGSKFAATGDSSSFNPLAKKPALAGAWDALSKPYARAIGEGRYSEAGGRFVFDFVSTFLGGRAANPAGKGSRTAPLVDASADAAKALPAADDAAKALPAADDLARPLPAGDDLAKTLTPLEAGKTLPQSPRQPYPTLNMPGAPRPHRDSDYFKWSDDVLPKPPDRPVIDFPSGPFSPAEAVEIAKKKLGVKFPWDPPSPTAVGDTLPAPQPKPKLPTGSGPAFADTQRVPQPTGNPPLPASTTEVLAAAQARRLVRPHYGPLHQDVWEYLGGTGPAPISYRLGNKWFIDGGRVPAYLRDLVEDQMAGL